LEAGNRLSTKETIDGARVAAGLVNTLDSMAPEPDFLQDPGRLEEFARWAGLKPDSGLAGRDLREVKALRTRLRKIFLAETVGEQVALLNAELRKSRPVPQFDYRDGDWVVDYRPPRERLVHEIAAVSAFGLIDVISRYGEGRMGLCKASPCDCVYVDRTRSGRRRFCCRLCNDRTSQAARRRRLAAT
jgi:predicted RNA-binding Zn ribbon-like protein